MAQCLFANLAGSTLAAGLSPSDTVATLAGGGGALFPNPGVNEYFVLTLYDSVTATVNEIVWVTARSGDVLTIVRAQESTAAQTWNPGDIAANLWTAGQAGIMLQENELQAQAGNYAVSTGPANAYVVALTPPVTVMTAGLPVRVAITLANTLAAVTLDAGAGAYPVKTPRGDNLAPGALSLGGIYTFVFDGTNWQIQNDQIVTISNSNGICRLYPDGWKEQSGVKASVPGDTGAAVTFPVPFLNAPQAGQIKVSLHIGTVGGSQDAVAVHEGTATTTGMTAYNNNINGNPTYDVSWSAQGF